MTEPEKDSRDERRSREAHAAGPVTVAVPDPRNVHTPAQRPGDKPKTVSVSVSADKAYQLRRAGIVVADEGADEAYLDSLLVVGERDLHDVRRELPPRKLLPVERRAIKLGNMMPPSTAAAPPVARDKELAQRQEAEREALAERHETERLEAERLARPPAGPEPERQPQVILR